MTQDKSLLLYEKHSLNFLIYSSEELEKLFKAEGIKQRYFEFEYIKVNEMYYLVYPNVGFGFNTVSDLTTFIERVAFFVVKEINTILFFELIDKEMLRQILAEDLTKNDTLSNPENFDIYILNDGRVLSADVYKRSGELYQNLDDYLNFLNYVLNRPNS